MILNGPKYRSVFVRFQNPKKLNIQSSAQRNPHLFVLIIANIFN